MAVAGADALGGAMNLDSQVRVRHVHLKVAAFRRAIALSREGALAQASRLAARLCWSTSSSCGAPRAGRCGTPRSRQSGRLALLRDLAPREREVALLVCAGCANAEIARELGCSVLTLEARLNSAFHKLRVRSRAQLLALLR